MGISYSEWIPDYFLPNDGTATSATWSMPIYNTYSMGSCDKHRRLFKIARYAKRAWNRNA